MYKFMCTYVYICVALVLSKLFYAFKRERFLCKTYGGLEEVQSLGHAMLLHSGGNGPAARAELPSD